MNDEVDLRRYMDTVAKHRSLVLAATVAGALLGVLVSLFVLPVTYTTAAIVVTAAPTLRVSLGSAVLPAGEAKVPAKAYAAMATNSSLFQQVVASLGNALPEALRSARALDELCSLSSLGDPSVMRFAVSHADPHVATQIANMWASLYVGAMRDAYGQSEADSQAITEQVEAAEQSLRQSELALSDFRAANPTAVLAATVAAYTTALSENLAAETRTESSLRDAQSLRQRLQLPGAVSEYLGRTLSVLIEINALDSRDNSGGQIQVPLLISSEGQEVLPMSTEALDALIGSLVERHEALAEERQRTSARLLQAQAELQRAEMETERLSREWAAATDTLQVLERQAKELRIADQLGSIGVRVALPAAVPTEPNSHHTALNMALGAAVGLVLAIATAIAAEYVLQPRRALANSGTGEA